jgi:hypothetical protein
MSAQPFFADGSVRAPAARWSGALTVIRVVLAIIFVTYGLVKILGGQYNYGDWVIDKKTVAGTSLVWAFYGYSPLYGRFTGLFELVPALMLLNRRTATIGAGALFAVSLNVTAMDFGFHYPAVKYFALAYTTLLAVLLWADREKWALLLVDPGRVHTLPTADDAAPERSALSPAVRRVMLVGVGLFVLAAVNVALLSVKNDLDGAARRALATRLGPDARLELVRSRQTGLVGIDWTGTVVFAVLGSGMPDTVTVQARRITAFRPWRVTAVTAARP